MIAAVVSVLLEEWSDAVFIAAVLFINAIIGAIQEYSAAKAAVALQELVSATARVIREGDNEQVDTRGLVPGDIVLLEPGDKIPADIRLIHSHGLQTDESLLTGESLPVSKTPESVLDEDAVLSERANMTFAGTLVSRGTGKGVVCGTGLHTELGEIAEAVLYKPSAKPPLLLRMERFTRRIAGMVLGAVIIMATVSALKGTALNEIFFMSVALAVSAIPEGLPVALTVALAIGMRRMSKRNVIIRRLLAVEALGSCTFIASDKTGTLTVNELTVCCIAFPRQVPWQVTGQGMVPEGEILTPEGVPPDSAALLLQRMCNAAVLSNDGFLGQRDGKWVHHGDAVDVALLVMAQKSGFSRDDLIRHYPRIANLPYESETRFSASVNLINGNSHASVKGALEQVLPMCARMAIIEGDQIINPDWVTEQALALAGYGYRVLAIASGPIDYSRDTALREEKLQELVLIGLVGMSDPLRPEAMSSVAACREAGIEVSMVTGDHPVTAFAIGRELGLANDPGQVVIGSDLKNAAKKGGQAEVDAIIKQARVFARVEPQQKLDIVESLQRSDHFVAVTGDGANDAPALRSAHVGVAMGGRGTDVARETADIIVTNDNFSSIVAGIEEGRVAYSNVRKVIFLLISTGAAEIVLFTLALFSGLPLPLFAVQLLWLNLVTNGIQDVALAFEPAEGGELQRPPRAPSEPIFNRLMVERVLLSAVTIGVVAYATFSWMLDHGYSLEQSRNGTLLLMVLFENVHVFNSRSETLSAFRHSPLKNRLLLFGTISAQLVHIGAMYLPGLNDVLRIEPVPVQFWLTLLCLALSVLVTMEMHKALRTTLGRNGN
jgi:magnesium-transporting ATPase (P-type)